MKCCMCLCCFLGGLLSSANPSYWDNIMFVIVNIVQWKASKILFSLFSGSQTSMNDSCESPSSSSSSSCPPLLTPTGSGPDGVGMFDMDSSDMSLSNSSGQQNFDPRRQSFSEEELKPQPMIKKARKILVPDDLKVNTWWNPHCISRKTQSCCGQLVPWEGNHFRSCLDHFIAHIIYQWFSTMAHRRLWANI